MTAKIATALHQVMQSVGYVQKTGKNAFHGYKYAGEADLLEKLRPAMLEAGLILIPSISDVSPIDEHGITTVRMEYTLVHKDGDVWPHKIGAAGAGGDKNKNGVGDKGLYKAITGANKYVLFKLFQIETGDDAEKPSAADSRSAYIEEAERTIGGAWNGPQALIEWWNSEAQKQARRFAGLTDDDVNALKLVVANRRTELNPTEGKAA